MSSLSILREAEGNLTQRVEDSVTMAAVIGVMQPQFKKYQQPPEAGRG